MDFFGILFDIKNGKKIPYSKTYFDTLFAAKLEELGVKTITGTLPLTFRTSETALRSWTIYGNNYEHKYNASGTLPLTFTTQTAGAASDWSISGNDKVGKNLLDIESATVSPHTTIGSVNNSTGSIEVTAESNYTYRSANIILTDILEVGKVYTITLIKNNVTPSEQKSNCTIRRADTNAIVASVGYENFEAAGAKSFNYTHTQERAEAGVYFSLIAVGNSSTGGTLSVSNLMLRERDTSAEFEPYQQGVGERTTNFIDLSVISSETRSGVKFTVDRLKGTVTVDGTNTSSSNINFRIEGFAAPPPGNYYFTGCPEGGTSSTYMIIPYDSAAGAATRKWDGTSATPSDFGNGALEVLVTNATVLRFTIRIAAGYTANNLVFKPFLWLGSLGNSVPFIPYGYEIPLNVNTTTQDIYIGSTPLTAGQSISKTSTGVDISAQVGSNTITTELYNKPEMSITGVDYVGVGAVSGDKYLIRVICSADISPYKPNAPESNTSYVYNDSTYTLDTDSQFKTALISWQGGIGSFTITKTKGSTFKLESLTFMGNWGGEDHYLRTTVITPTGISYTGYTEDTHLLITYYDSEVDTLTPQEIRESITVSASVHSMPGLPLLDAPLTEGETLTMEDVGREVVTFAGVENTIEPFNPEIYDYGDFEMSIAYK